MHLFQRYFEDYSSQHIIQAPKLLVWFSLFIQLINLQIFNHNCNNILNVLSHCFLITPFLFVYNPFFLQTVICYHVCVMWYQVCIYQTPQPWMGNNTKSVFKRNKTGLKSELSFSQNSCHTMTKEPSLSYYLPRVGRRRDELMPFSRALAHSETQKHEHLYPIFELRSLYPFPSHLLSSIPIKYK